MSENKRILGYKIIPLSEMLATLGEEKVCEIFSSFSSPLNNDVEYFLKKKSITFDKQGISKTHPVFTSYKNEIVFIGYFTLSSKSFTIPANRITKTMKKRIQKFGKYDEVTRSFQIPAPLIAQLSKNFTNNYNKLITGDELLKMACDAVAQAQLYIGGKIAYLECLDNSKLINFYESNGFVVFNDRPLDGKSREDMGVDYLLQLLKYL